MSRSVFEGPVCGEHVLVDMISQLARKFQEGAANICSGVLSVRHGSFESCVLDCLYCKRRVRLHKII